MPKTALGGIWVTPHLGVTGPVSLAIAMASVDRGQYPDGVQLQVSEPLPAPQLSAHRSRLQGQAVPHAHAAPAAAGAASQGVEQSPAAAAPQGPGCGPGQWWLASGSPRPPSASAPCGSPASAALALTPAAAAPRGLPGLPQPDPAAPAATSCEAHSAGGGTRHRGQGLEDRWPHQPTVP